MVIFKRCETATPNAYQVCQKFFEMLFNCRSKKIEDAFLSNNNTFSQKLSFATKQNEESAIIVAGGLGFASKGPLKSVEIFLASQNKWFPMGSLQSPRSWYPSLFILNNRLTCIGGKVRMMLISKLLHSSCLA